MIKIMFGFLLKLCLCTIVSSWRPRYKVNMVAEINGNKKIAEEWFQKGKSFYLHRKRSSLERDKCIEAFQSSLRIMPEWIRTDGRYLGHESTNFIFTEFDIGKESGISAQLIRSTQSLKFDLDKWSYTARGVQNHLKIPKHSKTAGPYYIKKNLNHSNADMIPLPDSPLDILIQMFLFGFSFEENHFVQLLSKTFLNNVLELKIVSRHGNSNYLVPNVQLFPLDANAGIPNIDSDDMVIAVDFPPPHSAHLIEEPVMYISTCSLALLQSLRSIQNSQHLPILDRGFALDMCCGSGVQGLSLLKSNPTITVYSADINRRALRFTYFNALLNSVHNRIKLVHSNLFESFTDHFEFSLILVNPPFVPVPPNLNSKKNRYDLFAAGTGKKGELIIQKILEESRHFLSIGGLLGIVAEVSNSNTFYQRLCDCLSFDFSGSVMIDSNPSTAEDYCRRRSGSDPELSEWLNYFEAEGIYDMTQCLIWLKKETSKVKTSIKLSKYNKLWMPESFERHNNLQGIFKCHRSEYYY